MTMMTMMKLSVLFLITVMLNGISTAMSAQSNSDCLSCAPGMHCVNKTCIQRLDCPIYDQAPPGCQVKEGVDEISGCPTLTIVACRTVPPILNDAGQMMEVQLPTILLVKIDDALEKSRSPSAWTTGRPLNKAYGEIDDALEQSRSPSAWTTGRPLNNANGGMNKMNTIVAIVIMSMLYCCYY